MNAKIVLLLFDLEKCSLKFWKTSVRRKILHWYEKPKITKTTMNFPTSCVRLQMVSCQGPISMYVWVFLHLFFLYSSTRNTFRHGKVLRCIRKCRFIYNVNLLLLFWIHYVYNKHCILFTVHVHYILLYLYNIPSRVAPV